MNFILMTIKPQYVEKIITGAKQIEVRRSNLNLEKGDVIFIYSSKPESSVIGCVKVKLIERLAKDELWFKYKAKLGISLEEYDIYLKTKIVATAIHLADFEALKSPISLQSLHRLLPGFRIPQSYLYLNRNGNGKYFRKLIGRIYG
jgi:predicted transcriptional regulator